MKFSLLLCCAKTHLFFEFDNDGRSCFSWTKWEQTATINHNFYVIVRCYPKIIIWKYIENSAKEIKMISQNEWSEWQWKDKSIFTRKRFVTHTKSMQAEIIVNWCHIRHYLHDIVTCHRRNTSLFMANAKEKHAKNKPSRKSFISSRMITKWNAIFRHHRELQI